MARFAHAFGPHAPDATYVAHAFPEQLADLGEVQLNYVSVGDASKPALLLVPGQTESWWGYEAALPLLAEHYHAFAVDLRGQGRSTRTPGRYTLDNMGNDLVRFIDVVIDRPVIVSGLSSGGVLSAWLSAYSKPGQVVAAHYEDPALFASQVNPATGQGIRQAIGAVFKLWSTFLGPQWSIGDWDGMRAAAPDVLPSWLGALFALPDEPPQPLKEYDPEWGAAFWSGTVAASCDHDAMLRSVRAPVLLTHHFRHVDDTTGQLMGAISDLQAQRVIELLCGASVEVDYRSFETMGHSMHGQDPKLFTDTLVDWSAKLHL
jgi:pimeloyl-ACP methyl ester carboxylesterase